MGVWRVGRANRIAANFPSFAVLLLNKSILQPPSFVSDTPCRLGLFSIPKASEGADAGKGVLPGLGFLCFLFQLLLIENCNER